MKSVLLFLFLFVHQFIVAQAPTLPFRPNQQPERIAEEVKKLHTRANQLAQVKGLLSQGGNLPRLIETFAWNGTSWEKSGAGSPAVAYNFYFNNALSSIHDFSVDFNTIYIASHQESGAEIHLFDADSNWVGRLQLEWDSEFITSLNIQERVNGNWVNQLKYEYTRLDAWGSLKSLILLYNPSTSSYDSLSRDVVQYNQEGYEIYYESSAYVNGAWEPQLLSERELVYEGGQLVESRLSSTFLGQSVANNSYYWYNAEGNLSRMVFAIPNAQTSAVDSLELQELVYNGTNLSEILIYSFDSQWDSSGHVYDFLLETQPAILNPLTFGNLIYLYYTFDVYNSGQWVPGNQLRREVIQGPVTEYMDTYYAGWPNSEWTPTERFIRRVDEQGFELANISQLYQDAFFNNPGSILREAEYAPNGQLQAQTCQAFSEESSTYENATRQTYSLFEAILSIHNKKETGLVVFPNPAGNLISLNTSFTEQNKYSFQIVDNQGRLLQRGNLPAGMMQIEIDHLPDGLYLLQLWNDEQKETHTARFLKSSSSN